MNIEELTWTDYNAVLQLALAQAGDITNERRRMLTQRLRTYMSSESPFFRTFGAKIGGTVKSFACVHFNEDNNSWTFGHSGAEGFSPISPAMIEEVQRRAQQSQFFSYYLLQDAQQDLPSEAVHGRYMCAVDEVVKANTRPLSNNSWDWLFLNQTRQVDTVVLHFWLPQLWRDNMRKE